MKTGIKAVQKAKPKPESADNYFELITDAELLELALAVRNLIKRTLPGVSECVKWDLPFYTYHGNLCYLNMRKGHLELGFYRGIHLSNSSGLLQGNGKLIRHIILHPRNDLPQAGIVETLLEASKVNENGPLRMK
jgi:hypothetical protein